MNQHSGYDWPFTINSKKIEDENGNFVPKDEAEAAEELMPFWEALDDIDYQYICARGERAPSGTYHVQGAVQFDDIWTKQNVIKHFYDRTGCNWVRVAKRLGTPVQMRDYVFKRGEYEEDILEDTTWDLLPAFEQGRFVEEDRHERKMRKPAAIVKEPKYEAPCKMFRDHNWVPQILWSNFKQETFESPYLKECSICGEKGEKYGMYPDDEISRERQDNII